MRNGPRPHRTTPCSPSVEQPYQPANVRSKTALPTATWVAPYSQAPSQNVMHTPQPSAGRNQDDSQAIHTFRRLDAPQTNLHDNRQSTASSVSSDASSYSQLRKKRTHALLEKAVYHKRTPGTVHGTTKPSYALLFSFIFIVSVDPPLPLDFFRWLEPVL